MSSIRKICILSVFVMGALCAGVAEPSYAAVGKDHEHAEKDTYYCPMHPQVVTDKPGECPICHMRLVKREDASAAAAHVAAASLDADPGSVCDFHECPMLKEGEPCPMLIVGKKGETVECPSCREKIELHGETGGVLLPVGYASVLITPQKQQLIGIRTAPVVHKRLERSLRTAARVAYDPELYEAQIEYLREHRIARGSLRSRELAFKNLQDSRWEAPRIDVATSKLVLMGMDLASIERLVEEAKADESLLYLKPDGNVWVYADVFESEAPQIRKGDRVRLEVPSMPGKTYEATVEGIGSIVDPETRRIRLRIRVKNEDGFLKPQMLLNATVVSAIGEGLAVPAEAVFFTGRAAIVFVDKGAGLFEPREVEVGAKAGDDYRILGGLSAAERVVVNGNFLLDSESKLKASIERAAAAHAGHGG